MDTLEKIVYILKQTNKTQKDLTDYLGVQKTAFTQWKLGKNTSYLKHISKIAEYLNVSADYLLGNSDIKNKPTAEIDSRLNENLLMLEEMTQDFTPEEWAKLIDHAELLKAAQKRSKQ